MSTTVQYANGSERTFRSAETAASELDFHEGSVILASDDEITEVNPDPAAAAAAADAEAARVAAEEAAIAEAARVAAEDAAAAEAAAGAAAPEPQVDPLTGLPLAT